MTEDATTLAEECERLARERCYCCEVWPENEANTMCERCMALQDAAVAIRELLIKLEDQTGQ